MNPLLLFTQNTKLIRNVLIFLIIAIVCLVGIKKLKAWRNKSLQTTSYVDVNGNPTKTPSASDVNLYDIANNVCIAFFGQSATLGFTEDEVLAVKNIMLCPPSAMRQLNQIYMKIAPSYTAHNILNPLTYFKSPATDLKTDCETYLDNSQLQQLNSRLIQLG